MAVFFSPGKYTIPSAKVDTDMKLTDTFLRGIKTTGKAEKHTDGDGLYL